MQVLNNFKNSLFGALVVILACIFLTPLLYPEYNPYPWDTGQERIDSTLRLSGQSMGAFQDAMKSYVLYTSAQNVPGTKESGVGYYYNNETKQMKRMLFWRIATGYARKTDRTLDFSVRGTGFFVVQLPGGWPAYTHDGRFDIDDKGRLVLMYHNFPVLGENGEIYLPGREIAVDEKGVIYYQGQVIDALRIEWVKEPMELRSFNQAIFHLSHKDMKDPSKKVEPDYTIKQGYVEDSSVTKAYIGLVPEWRNGFESNLKVSKAYLRNMSSAVQAANP